MLYNRTEHSQCFYICFIVKNPLNSSCITINFQNEVYFKSEQHCRQHALHSHKARYNKPIRIIFRMVQTIWQLKLSKVSNYQVHKPSKFTICNSSQTEIVQQAEFNTFSRSVSVLIQNLQVKCSVKSGRILAHKNMLVFSHDKQTARGMCDVNERQSNPQEHEEHGRYHSAVKLVRCDWCGLPLNESERISEEALSCSLGGRPTNRVWVCVNVTRVGKFTLQDLLDCRF